MATDIAASQTATDRTLLAAAEEFARAGLRVLPLRPGGKTPLCRRGVGG